MRDRYFYRYFLGCRPSHDLGPWLAAIGDEAGQSVREDLLHLTFCVIAEVRERDHFLLPRVRTALAGQVLNAFPIRLGRISGGRGGARAGAIGRQDEIQDFYGGLVRMLATRDITPLYRKSGLRPHITLSYDSCRFEPFKRPFEWFPDGLLLIESEVGKSTHDVIGRWPLLAPRQGGLFLDLPAAPLRLAS